MRLLSSAHILSVQGVLRLLGGDDAADEAGEGDVAQLGGVHAEGGELHLGGGEGGDVWQAGERKDE